MTDITRLLASLKRRSAHAKEFGDNITFVKLEDLDALIEAVELKEEQRANWFQMAQKLGEDLDAAEKRIAELEEAQSMHESDTLMLCRQFDELAAAMGWSSELAMQQGVSQLEYARSLKERIADLESRTVTVKLLKDHVDDADLFGWGVVVVPLEALKEACAEVGVRVEVGAAEPEGGDRNQPGMVVAVHVDAGDFVKVKGQVYEVEETDFDDHDVTLWFVCGETLKCAAGCQIEVVSAPEETE